MSLGKKFGIDVFLKEDTADQVLEQLTFIVEAIGDSWWDDCSVRANRSRYHRQYKPLDLELGSKSYLIDSLNINIVRWIFEARTDQIDLNFKP